GFFGTDQNDPEGRLKSIEQQLHALLKEVQGMRKGGAPKAATSVPAHTPVMVTTASPTTKLNVISTPPVSPEVALTRATYDLPAAKARMFADLLKDYKGPVVEFTITDDKMTVTTTPETQHTIALFIALLQG